MAVNFVYRNLRIGCDWPKISVGYDEDAFVEADVKKVAGLLCDAAADVGQKAWSTLERVGSSVLYTGRLISLKWPWMKIEGVDKEKTLKIAIPENKSAEFDGMIESGQMNKILVEDFKQPKESLRKILADKFSDELAELITKKLEGVTSSVKLLPSSSERIVGRHIDSNVDEELYNENTMVAGTGGNVVGELITGPGTVKRVEHGGVKTVVGGITGDQATKIAMSRGPGDKLKVTVRFSDRKVQSLVLDFAKDDIIRDLQAAILKQNGMDCIIKHGKTGETLDDFATFDELQKKYPDILNRYLEAEKRS